MTPRGKHFHRWREVGEAVLDALLLNGMIARCSFHLGLLGRLSISEYQLKAEVPLVRPLNIAFLSDFHAGPSTHPHLFVQAFQEIQARNVDVLLLGGDFISCKARYIQTLLPLLNEVSAPLGKFAVFGNHDLWSDEAYLKSQLEQVGVQVLVNQNITLPHPYDALSICGTDDPWTGDVNMVATFKDAQSIRILLTHAPDGLLFLDQEKFTVAFAGHTHGGQIAFNKNTPILLPHGHLSKQYHYGLFQIAENGHLIVSRGIGCSNLPIRINADPELVFCSLR
jgi:predicted MPP superfamily phosphohydrolase